MEAYDNMMIETMFQNNKRQYQIPVYQRNYDWNKDNCQELFNDIVEAYRNERVHFLGTMVQVQEGDDEGISRYLIIDGQQRTTSVYLLLKALYDLTTKDDKLRKDLEDLLFNKSRGKALTDDYQSKLKLKPIKSDNVEFVNLMSDRFGKIDKSSNIWINYDYFRTLIKAVSKKGVTTRNILEGLQHLQVVTINLAEPEDDPQVIFERINSTGEVLTLADLIRNYLLMTDKDRDTLFEDYWIPLENIFDRDSKEEFQSFFKDYLVYKLPDDGGKDAYHQFKKYCDEKKIPHRELMEEMRRFASYYHLFKHPMDPKGADCPPIDGTAQNLLKGYVRLTQTTIFPFFFNVFDDYKELRIDLKTLNQVLAFFLNYTLRRSIMGVPTNSLRGLYKNLYRRIFAQDGSKDAYLESIYDFMANISSIKDVVPSDTKLMDALKTANLYKNKAACKLILSIIENGLNSLKESVTVDDQVTIEHIMPQNEDNEWWHEEIGEDYDLVYSKYLHCLGNLTLTGYNSELSDKTFPEKKELLKNAKFQILDEDVLNQEHWNQQAIEERTHILGKRLLAELRLPSNFEKINLLNQESKHSIEETSNYSGRVPVNFTLLGESRNVDTWKDLFLGVLGILYDLDSSKLNAMAKNNYKTAGASKPLVSFDPGLLRKPGKVRNTGIYVETNRSANDIVKMVRLFLDQYGVEDEDFVFNTKPSKEG